MTAPTPAIERGTSAVMGLTSLGSTRNLVETALGAALDVEEMARVLASATWPDGSADGFPSKRVAEMLATALRAALLGGAA